MNIKQTPLIKKEWVESLSEYLLKTSLTNVNAVKDFEKSLAEYVRSEYTIAVNSGTSAIMLCMMCYGKVHGQEVIGPNYGNLAWVNCTRFLGMKPVFVDIKEDTLSLDPDLLEEKINDNTRIVVFLNHGGYVGPDLKRTREICDKHALIMIEDSCNAIGQRYDGKHAGTFGHFGMISYSCTKTLASGEGGSIIVNHKQAYDILKELRHHGEWFENREGFYKLGANFQIAPQNAFFLNQQLKDIENTLIRRNYLIGLYTQFLGDKIFKYRTDTDTGQPTCYYISKKAGEIHEKLQKFGIQSIYKQYVCHNRHWGFDFNGRYPVSEKIENECINLPMSLSMGWREVNAVSNIVQMVDK